MGCWGKADHASGSSQRSIWAWRMSWRRNPWAGLSSAQLYQWRQQWTSTQGQWSKVQAMLVPGWSWKPPPEHSWSSPVATSPQLCRCPSGTSSGCRMQCQAKTRYSWFPGAADHVSLQTALKTVHTLVLQLPTNKHEQCTNKTNIHLNTVLPTTVHSQCHRKPLINELSCTVSISNVLWPNPERLLTE